MLPTTHVELGRGKCGRGFPRGGQVARGQTRLTWHAATADSLVACVGEPCSEPWIHRFAFEGEHAEDTLMHAAKRLTANKTFECLDAEGELT